MENDELKAYLEEIVKRLQGYLKHKLVGVYLFGSAGYGAYEPGLSDLDVQAVVRDALDADEKQAIISLLNQDALPCPATKLEFVVYAQGAVDPASRHPHFELNLNTGPRQSDHISLDPASESSHWFLLDVAMGRALGRCLYGRATTEAFGVVPRRWVLEAISDSLEWHRAHELNSANSILNACRGWRFVATDQFSSKLDGAYWAIQQEGCPAVVEQAIVARRTGDMLPVTEATTLYKMITETINIKLKTEFNA